METLLTVFSAPKPFTNPHIAIIQDNAIQSWRRLGEEVQVILVGQEAGLAEAAARHGVIHLPQVARNSNGTPLVSSIFDLARQHSASPLLAYVNADILLLPDFLESARRVLAQAQQFLIVGQRWDLDVRTPLDFSEGWQERLRRWNREAGVLYPPHGSDYFIFPRACFQQLPDFAIGRAGWDNWMIFQARDQRWATVDATTDILDIHQKHDYSHLPGGQAHYHLPESIENARLAGGPLRKQFGLIDADRRLRQGRLTSPAWTPRKVLREFETLPLLAWRSERLARLFFYLFNPAWGWNALRDKSRRIFHPATREKR